MYKLGLIGFPLTHSLSAEYFKQKFKTERLKNYRYDLYSIDNLFHFNNFINSNKLIGLNVTSPYKNQIIKYIDVLDESALKSDSVNTLLVEEDKIKGFNTDIIGFQKIIQHIQIDQYKKALILGSGGVSRTVEYCLNSNNIETKIVSRKAVGQRISYEEISSFINEIKLIINTTPLGQYPNTNDYPNIPYDLITANHFCVDLIYNPMRTKFLTKCKTKGAQIIGGKMMFISQAEASWKIWNKSIKRNV